MSTVTVIPASNTTLSMLRVAAYCRVSSNSADQIHSYQAQITTYTNLIANHPDWKLVDIYADPGITGTSLLPRNEFQRMMTDCEAGKIDRILVKSISRFARNTKDCLSSLRQLASYGVSVLFEKENIDTKTLTTEMMVSVFGALAQQESVSISENQKISYQRRMEKGEFITCKAPFGYRLRNKTQLEIDPAEAPIVKWIFDSYLNGRSAAWIADKMTKQKILTRDHGTRWHPARVLCKSHERFCFYAGGTSGRCAGKGAVRIIESGDAALGHGPGKRSCASERTIPTNRESVTTAPVLAYSA